jgi:hypothetical protein
MSASPEHPFMTAQRTDGRSEKGATFKETAETTCADRRRDLENIRQCYENVAHMEAARREFAAALRDPTL